MKIEEVKIESISEMNEYLQRSGLRYFVFGKDCEVTGGLYIVRCCRHESSEFLIGIISEGHGLKPEFKCMEDNLFIGFNREVKIVDSNGNYKTVTANSLFYEFIEGVAPDEIIAVFELEIICFSLQGHKKWVHYTDSITDYDLIDKDKIHITTDAGEEILCLKMGNEAIPNTEKEAGYQ